MILSRQKGVRRLAVLALFAILAVAAFGFAAQNNVDDSYAGDGEGNIFGFDVTDIDYELDANDPTTIATVSFTLSPAPRDGEVWVQFQDASDNELDSGYCNLNVAVATCSGLSANVLNAAQLRVIAVD